MDGRPKAVLFDFGGVLTTPVWDTFAAFCRSEGLEPETMKRLFRENPEALAELRRLERGEVSETDFETRFGALLGVENTEGLIDRLFAEMRPDERMLGEVRRLKGAGLKTALVSNSWSTAHYDRELLAELFDEVLISGELGMHKPEPEIFELAAERVGAEPAECVFVDDLRENCEGAEAVGMIALRHREAGETIAKLEALTG